MENSEAAVPAEDVTADQIVALNMRYWRRLAGMTQEELGKRLRWSAANVSAAERSAIGERDRRRFDAQMLTELAVALGVPLIALFLPPEDDGSRARYQLATGDDVLGMGDVMAMAVYPDSGDDSPVMGAYRDRLTAAADRYLDPEWAEDVRRALSAAEPAEVSAARVERLRDAAAATLAAAARSAAEMTGMADAIERSL